MSVKLAREDGMEQVVLGHSAESAASRRDSGTRLVVPSVNAFSRQLLYVAAAVPCSWQSEESAKRVGELEKNYKAALHAGDERLREVLGSLHAVEKAFVQHKDR